MSEGLRSLIRGWARAARAIGFFLLLVLGSGALGIAIAWPLWYFATSARGPYTASVLILAAAGLVFLAVRAVIRARRAPRDAAGPRRSAGAALLAVVQAIVFLCGVYLAAILVVHGIWLFAVPVILVWLCLLALLGLARRAANAWRPGQIVPKIKKE